MLVVDTRQLMNQMESPVHINFMVENRILVIEVKDLGMLLDSHLKAVFHFNRIVAKCSVFHCFVNTQAELMIWTQ